MMTVNMPFVGWRNHWPVYRSRAELRALLPGFLGDSEAPASLTDPD